MWLQAIGREREREKKRDRKRERERFVLTASNIMQSTFRVRGSDKSARFQHYTEGSKHKENITATP